MTSNDTGKGWTDRQRLAYYFNLVEHSNVKLDYANAPRPDGKTVGACRIMVDRLKGTLKTELAALRGVDETDVDGGTPKKTPTPRKRKVKDADGETAVPAVPAKRGRKKKEVVVQEEKLAEDVECDEETIAVKPEPKEEEHVGEDF